MRQPLSETITITLTQDELDLLNEALAGYEPDTASYDPDDPEPAGWSPGEVQKLDALIDRLAAAPAAPQPEDRVTYDTEHITKTGKVKKYETPRGDEIFFRSPAGGEMSVHLERLGKKHFYLGIYAKGPNGETTEEFSIFIDKKHIDFLDY